MPPSVKSASASRVAAILMRDSRNHGAKFSTLGSFQFRDALDLDVHGSEATFGYPLTDHCFFFLSKSLGSDDPDSDQIPALLNDLSFHHMRQVDEDTVKPHHLAPIQSNHNIL